MMIKEANRACPICESQQVVPSRFSKGNWKVGVCLECGMIYLTNPPEQQALMDEFAWEKTKLIERKKRREKRAVYYFFSDGVKKIRATIRRGSRKEVRLLEKLRPSGGRLLDIGCADGGTLACLDEKHWKPYGIEPSPGLAARADTLCGEFGGHVVKETAVGGLPLFESNFFDALMMRSFLEHEVHVTEVLGEVCRVLKPEGFAIVKVPNAACWNAKLRGSGWPGVRHPDHVNYFTPRHLRRVIEQAGFARIKFPWTWRFLTSDNMWLVCYK